MNNIVLIGLGAIGTPIAYKLSKAYGDDFALVANGDRRIRMEKTNYTINGQSFSPKIVSGKGDLKDDISLIVICVKNYDVKTAIDDLKKLVSPKTVLLPLQNGIMSYRMFCEAFPNNIVLQGYVQGPNTVCNGAELTFTNSGVMHIGVSETADENTVQRIYNALHDADVDVRVERDITKMIWKKWMLNVAGNSVTALTEADYSQFKIFESLQDICRKCMREFLKVARAENIDLDENDIDDIIDYYVSYKGAKHTSMLEDVLNLRKTENEYLTGVLIKLAREHSIDVPITEALYLLIKSKESIYLDRKEKKALKTSTAKIYDGAKVGKNVFFGTNNIVGQDSWLNNCDFGDYVQINRRNVIENVHLGDYTYTGMNTVLKHVSIGKFCAISWDVSCTGNTHDCYSLSAHPFDRLASFGFLEKSTGLDNSRITIGNDVWIGAGAKVLPGVTVGDGAVIGAGSVVTKNVLPYSVVAGNPAKIIRMRFDDEIIETLKEVKWWNWPKNTIRENLDLFDGELTEEKMRRIVKIAEDLKR